MMSWVQITAGRGPDECPLAVAELRTVFAAEMKERNLEVTLLEGIPGKRPHTFLSVLLSVKGENVREALDTWEGTVQWIMKSPYRPNHGRKNWFIGVNVFHPPESQDHFSERDVRYEAVRASGPGGQHVNKISSAVRATHLPSGLSVLAQEERSQQMNKRLATARLFRQLQSRMQASAEALQQNVWQQHNRLERGRPIRIYRGTPMKREL